MKNKILLLFILLFLSGINMHCFAQSDNESVLMIDGLVYGYNHDPSKGLLKKENFSLLSGNYFNFTGIAGWFLFGKIMNKKMLNRSEISAFNKIVPIAKVIDKLFGKSFGLSIIVSGIKN